MNTATLGQLLVAVAWRPRISRLMQVVGVLAFCHSRFEPLTCFHVWGFADLHRRHSCATTAPAQRYRPRRSLIVNTALASCTQTCLHAEFVICTRTLTLWLFLRRTTRPMVPAKTFRDSGSFTLLATETMEAVLWAFSARLGLSLLGEILLTRPRVHQTPKGHMFASFQLSITGEAP